MVCALYTFLLYDYTYFLDIYDYINKKRFINIIIVLTWLLPFLQFLGDYFIRSFNFIWINCFIIGILMSKLECIDLEKYKKSG